MPAKVFVDNDDKLFITCFSGRVPIGEAHGAVDKLVEGANGTGVYRGFVIFSRDVDLSEWDGDALRDLRMRSTHAYRRLGLRRGESAAVINFVPEALLVMRVWNALCFVDYDIEMAFNLFFDLESALRFMAVSPRVHRHIVDVTMPFPA